ncbi:UbiA family prenyltransferase [bacterium]|nr:UbiA family prenyltransferase [candidate division CSSED10-310 bacterium]
MNVMQVARIARVNHWFKNLFVVAGWLLALHFHPHWVDWSHVLAVLGGTLLACCISSVNYIINEVTDAEFDRRHPIKAHRMVASGLIQPRRLVPLTLLLLVAGLAPAFLFFNRCYLVLLTSLFLAGIVYNVPPIRTKNIPILDIIIESVNFPIRISIGWFIHDWSLNPPPLLVLLLFWSLGAMLMTGKRLAEVRQLGDLGKYYRPTFRIYTQAILTVLIITYAICFLGLFHMFSRHLVPALTWFLPAVTIFTAWFLVISCQVDSIMVEPEKIFRRRLFFLYSLALVLTMGTALF